MQRVEKWLKYFTQYYLLLDPSVAATMTCEVTHLNSITVSC